MTRQNNWQELGKNSHASVTHTLYGFKALFDYLTTEILNLYHDLIILIQLIQQKNNMYFFILFYFVFYFIISFSQNFQIGHLKLYTLLVEYKEYTISGRICSKGDTLLCV